MGDAPSLTTASVEQTMEVAEALAQLVVPGDVILLSGGLGAGKTAFVKGLGRGLGVTEAITSPAFVLVCSYEGRVPLVHLDIYRLERFQEIIDLGIAELGDEDGVLVVEWGEAAAPVLPADFLHVLLELGDGDDDRHLSLACVGASWKARMDRLRRVLGPWTEGGASSC